MKTTTPVRRWLVSLRRAVAWHRRKLAVVAVIAAVLSSLGALMPAAPETMGVVRTVRAVSGGSVVSSDDLAVVRVPPQLVPHDALLDPAQAAGHVAAGQLADGQLVTASDLLDSRPQLSNGRVVAPIRLADGQIVGLLREGMLVDVLAADARSATAQVVASRVLVNAVPPPAAADSVRVPDGGLILVEVSPTVATALAHAAVVSQLSVVWR